MRLFLALSAIAGAADAFSGTPLSRNIHRDVATEQLAPCLSASSTRTSAWALRAAEADDGDAAPAADEPEGSSETSSDGDSESKLELTDEDKAVVDQVLTGFPDSIPLEDRIAAAMGGMHPRLVMALRTAADSADDVVDDSTLANKLREVGQAMTTLLDGRLKDARDLLGTLLDSGEIRKMDGLIGKAAKDGKLDMAFFSVLNMNLRDAAYEESNMSPEVRAELDERMSVPTNDDSGTAGRMQIMQHIYTRCQEEVEKTVAPGAGLLNKLLRTEVAGIRSNQLKHYLGPQATTIKSPDGQEIELEGSTGKALVSLDDFIEAVGNAVRQIRTVERAGGASRETAADLVESVRQIAIEGRFAMAEVYGTESSELREFEDGLQPIFRPGTENSEFIKGK